MKNNQIFVVSDEKQNKHYVIEASMQEIFSKIEDMNKKGGNYEILCIVPDELAKKLFDPKNNTNKITSKLALMINCLINNDVQR